MYANARADGQADTMYVRNDYGCNTRIEISMIQINLNKWIRNLYIRI